MSKNTGTSELINYFDLGANGDVGIAGSLDINTIANATTDTDKFLVSDTGIIKYRTGAQLLSDIGGQGLLTNPVTGTGTTNYLPKFTGSTTIGNSQIFDNGTNVGIGTTSPGQRLHVIDTQTSNTSILQLRLEGNGGNFYDIGRRYDNGAFVIQGNQTGFNNICLAPSGGNLLVGTTTDNGARLQISGTATVSSSLTAGSLISASATFSNFGSATAAVVAFADGNTGLFRPALNTLGITTAGTERMRITASGNVLIGTTTEAAGVRLRVEGGVIRSLSTYDNTVATAANLVVSAGGTFERSTSSLKYKKEVRNYDKGLEVLKNMRPVYYKGKSQSDGNKQFAGLIAEEIHELGLNEFVQYANDGTPDALAYTHMVAILINSIKELKQEIDTLKN